MKNIHVLPTDKPSRLHIAKNGDLHYSYEDVLHLVSANDKPYSIYITSDEEIKEGDWFIANNRVHKCIRVDNNTSCPFITLNSKGEEIGHFKTWKTKIIVTTDQDLIKDGVQAIDEEFLEWFVNNPSCEFVKIYYKCDKSGCYLKEWNNCCKEAKPILTLFAENESKAKYFREQEIISKEESKQEQCNCGGHPYNNSNCKIHGGIPKENQCRTPLDCGKTYNKELTTQTITCSKCGNTHTFPFGGDHYCPSPKQETLEEAAEKWNDKQTTIEFGKPHNAPNRIKAFIEGAKWQQERSYSEEEAYKIWKAGQEYWKTSGESITFEELVEQFKKK